MSNLINPYRTVGGGGPIVWGLIENMTDDSAPLNSSPQTVNDTSCFSFSEDESKIYVGTFNSDIVYQYSGTPGADLSTFSYDSKSFDFTPYESNLRAIRWRPDGLKCYIIGSGSNTVKQFSISPAWDISTAVDDSVGFATGLSNNFCLAFKPDGLQFFVGYFTSTLKCYTMSSAWDMSTAAFNYNGGIVASQVGFFFHPNGQEIVMCGSTTTLKQVTYASVWDFTSGQVVKSTYITSAPEEVQLTGVGVSQDGTKFYLCGRSTEDVHQYSL